MCYVLVSDVQQSASVLRIYILFQILFHDRLLQETGSSSLGYAVGPCCLSEASKGLVHTLCHVSWPRSLLPLSHAADGLGRSPVWQHRPEERTEHRPSLHARQHRYRPLACCPPSYRPASPRHALISCPWLNLYWENTFHSSLDYAECELCGECGQHQCAGEGVGRVPQHLSPSRVGPVSPGPASSSPLCFAFFFFFCLSKVDV